MQADYSKMYIQRKVSTIWSGSVFAIEWLTISELT